MKTYNIAFAGTFDIENYGDLMFPIVFEKAMKKRGMNLKVFLFSPHGWDSKVLDLSRRVYTFKDFERINKEVGLDALVIGGGAIIHFHDIPVRLSNNTMVKDYHNIHSWFSLLYLAAKNDIKIIFNLPQLPYDMPDEFKLLLKESFRQADYLSVRDEASGRRIKDICGEDDIDARVYPDAICAIDDYFDKKELQKIRKQIIDVDHYSVVHFSRWMPESTYNSVREAVEILLSNGQEVVFLPLGYTHGDDKLLKDFNRNYCDNKCIVPKTKLGIDDMTAILSGCDYYVGTSFHGIIVTIAYGGKAVNFNYPKPTEKNKWMYDAYGISNCLALKNTDMPNILRKIINGKMNFSPKRVSVKKKVNEHFDNIYRIIMSKEKKKKTVESILEEMFMLIPSYEKDLQLIDDLKKENKEQREVIDKQQVLLQTYSEQLQSIQESNAYRIGKKITVLPSKIKKKVGTRKNEKM